MGSLPPSPPRGFRAAAGWLAACCVVGAAVSCAPEAPLLSPRVPLTRSLAAGETHELRLLVGRPSYLRLGLTQLASASDAVLLAPGGRQVAAAAGPEGYHEIKRLSLVATAAGAYRLRVRLAHPPSPAARYRVEIEEEREARPGDSLQVAAEQGFDRARAALPESGPGHWTQTEPPGERDGSLPPPPRSAPAGCPGDARALSRDAAGRRARARLAALHLAGSARDRPSQAAALHALGLLAVRPEERLGFLQREQRLREEAGDRSGEAEAWLEIGNLKAQMDGDLRHAGEAYRHAREGFAGTGNAAGQALALAELGAIAGGRDEGVRRVEESLALCGRLDPTGRAGCLGLGLYFKGTILLAGSDLHGALEALEGAARQLSGVRHPEAAQALTLLGMTQLHLNLPADADALFCEAYQALGGQHSAWGVAYLLLGLGTAAESLGNDTAALGRFELALQISREQEDRHDDQAQALYHLGHLHRRQAASLAAAIGELEKAAELAGNVQQRVQALAELAQAHLDRGDREQARSVISQALLRDDPDDQDEPSAAAHSAAARYWHERGELGRARHEIELAVAIIEAKRTTAVNADHRVSFLASRHRYYERTIQILTDLDRREPGKGHDAEALHASEQARARGLLDLLSEGELGPEPPAGTAPAAHAAGRASSAPEGPAVLSLGEVQRLLGDSAVLLEYAIGERRSFLFVATGHSLAIHELQVGQDQLKEDVAALQEALENRGGTLRESFVHLARSLYGQLIAPAGAALRPGRPLLISPDGPLNALCFEALLSSDRNLAGGRSGYDLPYLIRDRAVSYVQSASVLRRLDRLGERGARQAGRLVAFGAPVSSIPGLSRLRHSNEEVATVAEILGGATTYLGPAASKAHLLSNPLVTTARYLHFACHGKFTDDPEVSGLALADGLVKVRDISRLELRDSALVVMSACDTGRGREVTGEGVIGMSRAFLHAGAASVVVSLWPVDDASTPQFMKSFYRALKAGATKAEALRQAKLEEIAQRDDSPFYWAPFVLVGQS